MSKLWLLYFGRLEREKWFDAILDMIEIFAKEDKKLPFEIFIFGDGSYAQELKETAAKHSEIHYFGRQDRTTIKRYVTNCQYCLIPSTFLETFWLTALTAISRWLPVIGFAKWWLLPFIDHKLDLNYSDGNSSAEKLFNLIKKLIHTKYLPTNPSISQYSLEARKSNFTTLAGPNVKKILLVSDFINKIWWIETYIHDVKIILESMGYEVKLFGSKLPSWIRGKIMKYIWMLIAICNDRQWLRLLLTLKKFKFTRWGGFTSWGWPDLIRYHSILRHLGWESLWMSRFSDAKKRMMYHDFGYVHPFPHALTQVNQIKTPLTLRHFIQSAKTKNPLKLLAVLFKFCSLSLIKYQLKKQIDTHLVPSPFMADIIHKSYKISPDKIKTFPHFVQE